MTRAAATIAALLGVLILAAPATAAPKRVRDPHDGATITVRAGHDVVLDLFANETTPYHWLVARRPRRRVARIVSLRYAAPTDVPPGMTGVPGRELVRIHARHRGRTRLVLAYTQLGLRASHGQPLHLRLRVR